MSIVVMGVCGSGKTTVGERLAKCLDWTFIEGDRLHPEANVARMRAGQPLSDAERWPWLDAIAAAIAGEHARGRQAVVACSALKRSYRERLTAGAGALLFVHLDGAPPLLAERMAARRGHYMPPGLLASQLATLEPPGNDEHALTLDAGLAPDALIEHICAAISSSASKEHAR